jgi:hypothetical protein
VTVTVAGSLEAARTSSVAATVWWVRSVNEFRAAHAYGACRLSVIVLERWTALSGGVRRTPMTMGSVPHDLVIESTCHGREMPQGTEY